MTVSLVMISTQENTRGLIVIEFFLPLSPVVIPTHGLVRDVSQTTDPCPQTKVSGSNLPFQKYVKPFTHCRVCLVASCFHSIYATES